jgi:hypothetical protein
MSIFSSIQLRIDRKYRKLKFAKILLNGIKSEMLASLSYVKAHIEYQQEELQIEKDAWKERIEMINEKYAKLNSYGYKNRSEYFNAHDDDPDLVVLDIIEEINRMTITPEDQEHYSNTTEGYLEEIEASEKALASLEKMSPIISSASIKSEEEIEKLFEENECTYLLHTPIIIDVSKILSEHYFQ